MITIPSNAVGDFSDDRIMIRWEPVGKSKDLDEKYLAEEVKSRLPEKS